MYHFNSLTFSLLFILSYFLNGCFRIAINSLIYNNIVWINFNLISIAYKNFVPLNLCSLSQISAGIVLKIVSLYILIPSTQMCNVMQLPFKLDKRKKVRENKYIYVSSIFIYAVPLMGLLISSYGLELLPSVILTSRTSFSILLKMNSLRLFFFNLGRSNLFFIF